MDLAALRTRVRLETGMEMDALRSDAEVDASINEAYQAVVDTYDWPWRETAGTFSTVDGQASYSLSGDVSPAIELPGTVTVEDGPGVGDRGPWEVEEVPLDYYHRVVSDDPSDEDTPFLYARDGVSDILLAPVPDDVYTVQVAGLKDIPDLSGDAAEPEFDAKFHPVVAYAAAAQILDSAGFPDRSEAAEDRAGRLIQRMYRFYIASHDDDISVMGAGRGYGGTFLHGGRILRRGL